MKSLKSLISGLAKAVAVIAILGIVLVFAMRLADDPWGMLPGGAFSQSAQAAPDSWTFTKELNTVEFQLLEPVSSRTSWIVEHNNQIYIPSGYMSSTVGKLWKHWPMRAEENGEALLRINDQVYPIYMLRIKDPQTLEPVLGELARKYIPSRPSMAAMQAQVVNNDLWIFELRKR